MLCSDSGCRKHCSRHTLIFKVYNVGCDSSKNMSVRLTSLFCGWRARTDFEDSWRWWGCAFSHRALVCLLQLARRQQRAMRRWDVCIVCYLVDEDDETDGCLVDDPLAPPRGVNMNPIEESLVMRSSVMKLRSPFANKRYCRRCDCNHNGNAVFSG